MPRKPKSQDPPNGGGSRKAEGVSLKQLAAHLNLSTTTLSLVLNDAPTAGSIPQETKDRIFSAARELNYKPNYLARSLRVQRTHTFGVIVPELSDGYSAMVLNGVEAVLSKQGYFYLTASHLHREDLLTGLPQMLAERQVEGVIAVDTPIRYQPHLPTVNVSGHEDVAGVTNVILNHQHAAELGVGHLYNFGHRRIAVIKGQEFSSDTNIRLETIREAARRRDITIDPKLTIQLQGDSPSPEVGYSAMKSLLATGEKFTAVFAFNDVSAIGAIRALEEMGLRVPADVSVLGFDDIYAAAFHNPALTTIRQPLFEMGLRVPADVSVLGFDDIYAAAFHNPALTTIRQPLFEMGSLAAETLLGRLADGNEASIPEVLSVEPTLVVRNSTARVTTG